MTTWILHCHHDVLCEPAIVPLAERQAAIQQTKPDHEIPTRLRLMRELTDAEVARLPSAYHQARVAYHQTRVAYNQAMIAGQAMIAYDQAMIAYDQAVIASAAELGEWHRAVCVPDCPWDGTKLIFPLQSEGEQP